MFEDFSYSLRMCVLGIRQSPRASNSLPCGFALCVDSRLFLPFLPPGLGAGGAQICFSPRPPPPPPPPELFNAK